MTEPVKTKINFMQSLWNTLMLIHDNILQNEDHPEIRGLLPDNIINMFYDNMDVIARYLKEIDPRPTNEEDEEFLNVYIKGIKIGE